MRLKAQAREEEFHFHFLCKVLALHMSVSVSLTFYSTFTFTFYCTFTLWLLVTILQTGCEVLPQLWPVAGLWGPGLQYLDTAFHCTELESQEHFEINSTENHENKPAQICA